MPSVSPADLGAGPVPDARRLARIKQDQGLAVSVCIPARDEEATVGHIIATVRRTLMETTPLVDEIVVLDDGSVDATADVAAWEGARVLSVGDVLPETGAGRGKGNAMWRSLYAASGDIVCWVDADIRNFGPQFVTGLVGPLLTDPDLAFVKGYYRRPLHGEPTGGGRVTELLARPLLSVLFPELAGFVQPLSGEYAGAPRRAGDRPVRRGLGCRARPPRRRRRAGRAARHGPSGPRRARAPEPTARGARAAGNRDPRHRTPARRVEHGRSPDADAVHRHVRARTVEVDAAERPPMDTVPAYRTKFGLDVRAAR